MTDLPSSSQTSASLLSQLRENGGKLRENLRLRRDGKYPIMMPPIPRSKFPDKFFDETLKKAELKEIRQQKEYEAEVEVYHTLERLEALDLTVFHGFEYTAEQYSLFVRDDEPKEGETDFILIGEAYRQVAILEVKAPDFENGKNINTTFKRNLKDSENQRQKIVSLVGGIINLNETQKNMLLNNVLFTLFFTLKRDEASNIPYYNQLDDHKKRSILFQDDLFDTVTLRRTLLESVQQIRQIRHFYSQCQFTYLVTHLYGLWYTNKQESLGSFTRAIEYVDYHLRKSIISRRPEGPPSSFVKGGSKVFKNHLDIDCITADQKAIFNCNRTKLWINGPTGTGKTILIAAKVIEMAQKSKLEGSIIVFAMKIDSANKYEHYFRNAGIKCRLFCNTIKETEKSLIERVNLIYFRETGSNSTSPFESFVACINFVLSNDYHVFFDDFHVYYKLIEGFKKDEDSILGSLIQGFRSTHEKTLWITFDHHQSELSPHISLLDKIEPQSVRCLRSVVRNSYEITKLIVSIKRSMDIGERPHDDDSSIQTFSQDLGHYVHGFTPNLHITFSDNFKSFRNKRFEDRWTRKLDDLSTYERAFVFLEKEPIIFQKKPVWPYTEVVFGRYRVAKIPQALFKIDSLPSQFQQQSSLEASAHFYEETFSMEWPAVFLILDLSSVKELESPVTLHEVLRSLYIGASRARCYLSIIVNVPIKLFEHHEFMTELHGLFGLQYSPRVNSGSEESEGNHRYENVLSVLRVFAGHVKMYTWQPEQDVS